MEGFTKVLGGHAWPCKGRGRVSAPREIAAI